MGRAEVVNALQRHAAEIRGHGVRRLALFGSLARNEDGPESDVDILVEFERPISLFGFLEVKEYLESLLGRSVDLVTREALKPQLRDRILGEAVNAI